MMEIAKDEERISELPETLCLHLLSLLPRKDAIRTGVLSSRWKDLWKSRFPLPNTTMDFGQSFIEGTNSDQDLVEEIAKAMKHHGENKIEVFNLFIHPSADEDIVSAWIQQASANGVEEATIDFSRENVQNQNQIPTKFLLNANVFKGNSLVFLSLCNCKLEGDFRSSPFRFLESLHLDKLVISETVLREIASNCHVLSKLELRDCIGIQDLILTSPALRKLKKLVVVNCWRLKTIQVSSPVIVSVNVSGQTPCLLGFRDVSCLQDASMVSEVRGQNIKYYNPREDAGKRFVNSLALSSNKLEYAFGSSSCPYGDIKYLSGLQLVVVNNDWLAPIYIYPGRCEFPYLEKLFVELPPSYEDVRLDFYKAIEIGPPTCAFKKLKAVKLTNFKNTDNEALLLRFILAVGTKLRVVIVVYPHEEDGQLCNRKRESLSKDVARMSRASQDVDVMICCSYQYTNNHHLSHNLLVSEWPLQPDYSWRNFSPLPLPNEPPPSAA